MSETAGSSARRDEVLGTTATSAAILACGVLTGLIAARSLGPSGRGELATITVWAGTLLYAGTMGLPEAVAYFAAAERPLRDRIWTTGQIGAIALGLVVTGLGWILVPVLFADRALSLTLRGYLLFFVVPGLASLCACAWLQGVGRIRAFNASRLAVHLVNALGFTVLLCAGTRSVRAFAAALLVGNAATWLVASSLGPIKACTAAPHAAGLARRMWQYGLRVQIGTWSNAANVRLDQLLLSLVATSDSLGIYVVAVTYASVLLTIPGSAALVMLPRMVNAHRDGTARACLERWYRRMLWVTVAAATVLAMSSVVMIPALFGSAFVGATRIAVLLAPATVMLGLNQVLSTAFRGIGRPEIASAAEIVGVAATVAGLLLLLPRYGTYGAAGASLIAYSASHVYLARQAVIVFGTDLRSLSLPTHADREALRMAGARTRQFLDAR